MHFTSFVGRDDHKTLGSGDKSLWGGKAVPARACLQGEERQAWTSEAPFPEFPNGQKAQGNWFVNGSFSVGLKCVRDWERRAGWMRHEMQKGEKHELTWGFYKKTLRSTCVTPFPRVRDFLCHEWVLLCNGVQREISDRTESGPTAGGKQRGKIMDYRANEQLKKQMNEWGVEMEKGHLETQRDSLNTDRSVSFL